MAAKTYRRKPDALTQRDGYTDPIAEGSMSTHNATTLLLGNPVRNRGLFYRTHHELADSWHTWRISSADSPLVASDFLTDMAQRYGEESNAYPVSPEYVHGLVEQIYCGPPTRRTHPFAPRGEPG
jgi:hypothetical protein